MSILLLDTLTALVKHSMITGKPSSTLYFPIESLMSLINSQSNTSTDHVSYGHVYIMTHSIFSNVIRIGCTPNDAAEYARSLSAKTPGDYQLYYALACSNPCKVKKQIREHLEDKKYINEFYEVSPDIAKNILKREVMKIPVLSIS